METEALDFKKLAQEALEDHRKTRVYNLRLFLKKNWLLLPH